MHRHSYPRSGGQARLGPLLLSHQWPEAIVELLPTFASGYKLPAARRLHWMGATHNSPRTGMTQSHKYLMNRGT